MARKSNRQSRQVVWSAVLAVAGGIFLAGPGVQAARSGHSVVIHLDRKVGLINPNIYGHFAEHLGNCIEEGIWVGEDSDIPNVRGIRTDVVEALRKIKPPVIRWPGGCFADSYHWKDGIGPRENRPKRINVHWGRVTENNHFGTHEFIDFCRQVGAEPMIAANVRHRRCATGSST